MKFLNLKPFKLIFGGVMITLGVLIVITSLHEAKLSRLERLFTVAFGVVSILMAGPMRWRPKPSIREWFNGAKGTYISATNRWMSRTFRLTPRTPCTATTDHRNTVVTFCWPQTTGSAAG